MGKAQLADAFLNILKIFVNFGTEIGHLWFVYMLIGIYLFAPILSPCIQTASRRPMELYLLLWSISLTVPYIHLRFPEILGEAYWNHTPLLYYFSGFLGYVVLAVYIKRFFMQPRAWHHAAGVALILAGYAITAFGFIHLLPSERYVRNLELTWGFETINVAMMAAGVFLLLKNMTTADVGSPLTKLILDISAKSYGIYLAHIMVLNACHELLNERFTSAAFKIPLIAAATLIGTYILIKLLSFLPKSKWLVG